MQIPSAPDSIFNQMHKHHFGVSTSSTLKNRPLYCKIWYFHSSVAVGHDVALTSGSSWCFKWP